MTALLRFESVTLSRGGRRLFEDLDLAVNPGERLQVTGPNGSGKSSLLRLAAGLLPAQRGTIDRGEPALADDHPALDRELPLIEALRFWTRIKGSAERLERALNTLGLAELRPVPVRMLSSGQLKRATIARVAGSGALLWLLDEPLNALDRGGVDGLAEILDRHTASGGAVVAASHFALPGKWRQLELRL